MSGCLSKSSGNDGESYHPGHAVPIFFTALVYSLLNLPNSTQTYGSSSGLFFVFLQTVAMIAIQIRRDDFPKVACNLESEPF